MEEKSIKKRIVVIFGIILLMIGAMAFYLSDGYDATEAAKAALMSDEEVTVTRLENAIVFMPAEAKAGLIFYPGGKVAYEAYALLMNAYAKEGMACVLLEMPLDLAVLDMNAAEKYRYQYPEIEKWYVGGHSLGGAMAASYLEKHVEEYEGLILCAAYSAVDYSETDLQVISIYGSNDEVLNAEKYEDCRKNLPDKTAELVIEGGNHAFFGTYGEQDGDGIAAIENGSQIAITVEFTMQYIY